jgi:hypothetical protein
MGTPTSAGSASRCDNELRAGEGTRRGEDVGGGMRPGGFQVIGRNHAVENGNRFTRRRGGAESGPLEGRRARHRLVTGCQGGKARDQPLSPRPPRLRVRQLLHGCGFEARDSRSATGICRPGWGWVFMGYGTRRSCAGLSSVGPLGLEPRLGTGLVGRFRVVGVLRGETSNCEALPWCRARGCYNPSRVIVSLPREPGVRFATPGYPLKSLRDKGSSQEERLCRAQEQHWYRPHFLLRCPTDDSPRREPWVEARSRSQPRRGESVWEEWVLSPRWGWAPITQVDPRLTPWATVFRPSGPVAPVLCVRHLGVKLTRLSGWCAGPGARMLGGCIWRGSD